jgi:hypothetical protein
MQSTREHLNFGNNPQQWSGGLETGEEAEEPAVAGAERIDMQEKTNRNKSARAPDCGGKGEK